MKRRGRSTSTHSVSAEGPKGKLPPALPWQGLSLQYRGNGNQHPPAAPHHPRAQPGSDPGAEGAGREPLSSLTQCCWSSRHIGSVQGRLGAVVCSPVSAGQELPPANPAPDTVAANQTAIWVLVSFNSSARMDGGTGAWMDGREHSVTAFPMSLPIPVIKPAAVESL